MGATNFVDYAKGETAKIAFNNAVEQAHYDCGHRGYTGTIAEKDSFIMIECPAGKDPENFIQELIVYSDPRIDNKWGPAGCILVNKGETINEYAFFGWASC